MHVARFDQIRLHQLSGFASLELQLFTASPGRVLLHDEVDHLFGVVHRIAPPLEAGLLEGVDPILSGDQLPLGGKQVVAVEVEVDGARTEDPIGDPFLLQIEGLGSAVGADGIHLARQQCLYPLFVGKGDPVAAAGMVGKVGQQLVGARLQHQSLVGQIGRVANIWPIQREQNQRRVLQQGGEHHHRATGSPIQQQVTAADAKLGLSRDHLADHIGAGVRFAQGDMQTGLPIKPFGDGRVVTGKLELVLPRQLDDDLLAGSHGGRGQGRDDHTDQHWQKPAEGLAGGCVLRHTTFLSGAVSRLDSSNFVSPARGEKAFAMGYRGVGKSFLCRSSHGMDTCRFFASYVTNKRVIWPIEVVAF